jgi:hypothetical protein
LPGVQTIIAVGQPVLRNLWITTAYHDLAAGMTGALGSTDASWSAFATWASKTAGVMIRGDELADFLTNLFRASPERRELVLPIGQRLGDVPGVEKEILGLFEDPIARVSRLIAEGNLAVFRELGPPFANMSALFDGQPRPGRTELDAFLAGVKPLDGDPAELRRAFGYYCAAALEPRAKPRAELVLLASGLIGLIEQARLQPIIKDALDTPFGGVKLAGRFGTVLEDAHALVARWSTALAADDRLRLLFDGPRQRLIDMLERLWREALTHFFMTLEVPTGPSISLGHDVPPFDARGQFPPALADIADPDLQGFLARHDRTGGTARASGAEDWANLGDRMNYIVNLFRSWQERPDLLDSPFSAAQIDEMQAGRIPLGPL